MRLILEKPMKISFDEIEIDEHLPSIKFAFIANATQFSNALQYSGDIWINCQKWDDFVSCLHELKDVAVLNDMNETFFIKLQRNENQIEFIWSVTRQGVVKDIIQSGYQVNISEDILKYIAAQFRDYPKWW